VLPEWGVVWQTKDFVRDEVSAPAASYWIASIMMGDTPSDELAG